MMNNFLAVSSMLGGSRAMHQHTHRYRADVVFQKNFREAKGQNLPSILEETRVLDKYLGIYVDYTYFHEKWCTRKSGLKQRRYFLRKNSYIWPMVSLLLLRISDSKGPGGHFASLLP